MLRRSELYYLAWRGVAWRGVWAAGLIHTFNPAALNPLAITFIGS
ncbi:hypothetical protein [Atlantibacter sp.]|nr:hypothetical protein [Atlantibacter sp.]